MKEYGDYLEELLGDNQQTKILANMELSLFEKLKELDEIGYRVVKKLTIPNVSNQRETLEKFADDWNKSKLKDEPIFERDINSHLKGETF